MKFRVLIILLCWLASNRVNGQELSIASYNLRGNTLDDGDNSWDDRKYLVVNLIEKYKFDVIGLQETEASMVGYLMSAMPRFDSVGVFQKIPTGLMYNTNRLSLQGQGHFWLSATPNVESKGWDAKFERICVWAYLKDNLTGLEFYVFSTHFDHVGTEARTNSVALVKQKINEIAGSKAAIFLGDLNLDQFTTNYLSLNNSGILKDSYNLASVNHEKERGTGNGFVIDYRKNRIDHIFLTNNLRASSYDVLLDTYAGKIPSDHYPVVTKVFSKYNELGDLYRQFPEDFEEANPLKSTYAAANVTFRTGSWLLSNAIVGASYNNDRQTSGLYSVRMAQNNTSSAYLQMNFDVAEGASKVTVQHSTYATDSVSKWQLEYSKNQGATWQAIGPVFTTHQGVKQQATITMDLSGNVRFRINKFALTSGNNGRLSIDDIAIYKRKNTRTETANSVLLAWQFANPTYNGNELSASSSYNHPQVNGALLTRGSGLASANITRGFGATATVATPDASADTTSAVSNNLFYQFSINPKASQQLSLTGIDVRLLSAADGGQVWYWKYSLDGINYKFLAKPFRFNNATTTSLATVYLANIVDLQKISSDKTIYFRLYVNGASTTGKFGIGTSLASTTNDYALSVTGFVESSTMVNKLAAWQFASPQSLGNENTYAASVANNAVTVADLHRGSGLKLTNNSYATPLVLARTFASVATFSSSSNVADTSLAIANNMYFGFSIAVKPSYSISLSSINYKIRISAGGAKVWYWKYSLDGTTFVKIANPIVLAAATDTEGEIQPQLDLSSIKALQNLLPGQNVYFRIYTNGSNISSGTTAIGRSAAGNSNDYSLVVNGTVKDFVVAPKVLAWQFATPQANGNETSTMPSLVDNSLIGVALQRGAGIKNTTNATGDPVLLSRAFASVTNISTSAVITDTVKSVASDMHFKFAVTVKPSKKLSLTKLNYKIRISSGGAKVWYWKYSLDGINFERIALPIVLAQATDTEGDAQPSLDLSNISDLQEIPGGVAVYFRLYVNGSNTSEGTTSFGRSAATTTTDYILSLEGITEDDDALNTLPVQLVFFKGNAVGDKVQLNWQTASEKDNQHFEVVRLTNTLKPEVLTTVNGTNQSNTVNNYSFADWKPLAGTSYYQLRQMDYNGKTELLETVSIKRALTENGFTAYAKNNKLSLSITSDEEIQSQIMVNDISGKILINQPILLLQGNTSIQLPFNYPIGIYIVNIQKRNGEISTKKIIQQ